MLWVFVYFASFFLAVWFDVNAVSGCVLYFLLVTTLSVKMWFSCWWSLCGSRTLGGAWKCVELQRLMWWVSDKFPTKVCVWSGYECIFYVLWIKGKSEIKLILTRYNTLFTVSSFIFFNCYKHFNLCLGSSDQNWIQVGISYGKAEDSGEVQCRVKETTGNAPWTSLEK